MTTTPSRDEIVGTQIDGRYRIERMLGAGTMGAVYEATQLAVGRRVAVKLLRASLEGHEELRERFRMEARAIAALNHPHCITLYDFGWSEQLRSLYMVVEYVEGSTLLEFVEGGLEIDRALRLAQQIAEVCAHAHDAGILHRDLKPENVMLVEDDDVRVLDFGLARIFDATLPSDTRLTRQGQVFGSPAYMSPEQCGGALDVTAATDVYALGVTMYEMLSGKLPFESESVPELLVMHAKEPPPPLDVPTLPDGVAALVGSMLRKNPEDRPSAREVADRLESIRQRSSRDVEDATTRSTEIALDRPIRKDRTIILTAVIFCCVGVAAAVALLVNLDQQTPTLSRASATPGTPKSVWKPTERPATGASETPDTNQTHSPVELADARSLATRAADTTGQRSTEIALHISLETRRPERDRPPSDSNRSERDRKVPAETDTKPAKFRKLEFSY